MSTRTILIPGVAGFLGRHLAREFLQRGWRVAGLDVVAAENAPPGVDYRRLALPDPALGDFIREVRPAACVHCAGRASVALSLSDPAADFHDAVPVTFALLEALRRQAPECRTVLLSSAAVYGNPQTLPVGETQPPAPLSPYGYHKLLGEILAEEFSRLYALPTASVRIFSAYGPGLRRQVVWDICTRVLTTGTLRLRGTGQESRDFIHAADVAAALAVLIDGAPCQGERYNVASGRETTIAALATTLLEALGVKITPEFDGTATPGDPRNWRADISRLGALGFSPSIGLEAGLRSVAAWALAELQTKP
jgi:UDP-glucose 4-epimerase